MPSIEELEIKIHLDFNIQLKPKQIEVLTHLSRGRSVAGLLPTGYGKSICFWAPSLCWGWRIWIISPLISLIEDQRLNLKKMGIASGSSTEKMGLENDFINSKLFFMTPEFLASQGENIYEIFKYNNLAPDLIVFDEAHCLDQWKLFRSSYISLIRLFIHQKFCETKVLFLSATHSLEEVCAWKAELGINIEIVKESFLRKNLYTTILPISSYKEYWINLFSCLRNIKSPKAVILYAYSRSEVESIHQSLLSAGLSSSIYHAGLSVEQKKAIGKQFSQGKIRIICATSAFGMGIDYPYVERVIHLHFPLELSNYWQQSGRAGRSGDPAISIVFWKRSDVNRLLFLKEKEAQRFLHLWESWANPSQCRLHCLDEIFQEKFIFCGTCDFCVNREIKKNFSWLPEQKNVWWLDKNAKPIDWVREKYFEFRKDLDAKKNPDSVLSKQ
ncbi:MAG: RecQ family ATP-dependent DNA helicase [Oligoflexia bacterium]|nr:RecQ family ATP-dependent DNA helicase [Oligoflexia bacterium]